MYQSSFVKMVNWSQKWNWKLLSSETSALHLSNHHYKCICSTKFSFIHSSSCTINIHQASITCWCWGHNAGPEDKGVSSWDLCSCCRGWQDIDKHAASGSDRWEGKGEAASASEETLLEQRAEGRGRGNMELSGEQAKPRDREALRWREAWSGRRGQSQHGRCISDVMLWAVVEWSVGGWGPHGQGPLEDCEQEFTGRELGFESNLLAVT